MNTFSTYTIDVRHASHFVALRENQKSTPDADVRTEGLWHCAYPPACRTGNEFMESGVIKIHLTQIVVSAVYTIMAETVHDQKQSINTGMRTETLRTCRH